MSNPELPRVRSNQRALALDFNRLSDRVHDLFARVAAHVLIDTTSATVAKGVKLWGLDVNTDGLAAGKIRVTSGAALVPAGHPGDPERDPIGAGAWRLVTLDASTIIDLTIPVGASRVDAVQLALAYTDTQTEAREFRVEADAGDTTETDNVSTMRRPVGTVSVVEGVANADGGAVQIGTITVATDGGVTYVETAPGLFQVVAGHALDDGGGRVRGLRRWGAWVRDRLAKLDPYVFKSISGGLSSAGGVEGPGGAVIASARVHIYEDDGGNVSWLIYDGHGIEYLDVGDDFFGFSVKGPTALVDAAVYSQVDAVQVTQLITPDANVSNNEASTLAVAPQVFIRVEPVDGGYVVVGYDSDNVARYFSFYLTVTGRFLVAGGTPLEFDDI